MPAPARQRRSWGAIAILLAAVLVQAGISVAVVLAGFAFGNLNPPPPENAMLATAQQSVVTVNVAGDHFKGSASGFFIDGRGDILTNYHVIQHAWAVTVTTQSGEVLVADRVGGDFDHDVAEIQVATEAPPLHMRQDPPQLGEQVYVLGNPGGDAPNSVSKGQVVSLNRSAAIEGTVYTNLAMTNTEVRPGSSGSAVVDRRGSVVGMVAVGSSTSGGFIVDSTLTKDLRFWRTIPPDTFHAPAPDIQVLKWNWSGKYCNPGCGMTANIANHGGPGKATVTFSVLSSDHATTLATCARQVTLYMGDQTTVACLVVSTALINYWNVPYQREVWGDVVVGSVTALPISTT